MIEDLDESCREDLVSQGFAMSDVQDQVEREMRSGKGMQSG